MSPHCPEPGWTNKVGGNEGEPESTRPLGWVLRNPGGLELTSPQRALRVFLSPGLPKLKSRQKGFTEKRGSLILGCSWILGMSEDFPEPLRKIHPCGTKPFLLPPTSAAHAPGSPLALLARPESDWLEEEKVRYPPARSSLQFGA